MFAKQRKQFSSTGNLAVRGVGYTVGEGTACCSRPAGSATGTQASRKTTLTSTTLRKSGSVSNVRAVATPSGSKLGAKNRGMCNCQQLIDLGESSQLQEQYTRNLQQQIYFLELENSYLRHGGSKVYGGSVDGEGGRFEGTSSQRLPDIEVSPSRFTKVAPEPYREEYLGGSVAAGYSGAFKPSREPPSSDALDVKPHLVVAQAELLRKLEDSYQREQNLEERLNETVSEMKRLQEENARLHDRSRQAEAGFSKAEDNFGRDKRALMEEIVELQRRLDDLTPTLAQKESYIAKLEMEKDAVINKFRNTTNQLSALQIKMDERKREEAALSELEGERRSEVERLMKNIKRLEGELNEHKEKERSLIEEVAAVRRSLREEQLRAKKDKALAEKTVEENNALIRENSQLSAQISRFEMEMADFSKESARRATEIAATELNELRQVEKSLRADLLKAQERIRSEQDRVRHAESQFEDYQRHEEEAKEGRSRMQKELDALQALSKSLTAENKTLRQEKLSLNERIEDLIKKMSERENELSSVRYEMKSLADTNRVLQQKLNAKEEEKALQRNEVKSLAAKNQELQQKLLEKEEEVHSFQERCETIDRQYRQMLVRLDRETAMQNEKANEYEQLANRVRELSASLSRDRASRSATASGLPVTLERKVGIENSSANGGTSSTSILRHSTERRSEIEKRSASRTSFADKKS